MASGPSPSTKETTNYARLCRLLVDVGSHALRETFDQIHPAVGLHTVLGRHPEHTTLQQLRRKKILNPTQWGKLYPTIPSSVSSAGFDITLLMVLLRNICGLTRPLTGWDSLPSASDVSKEANIARVKYFRNTVYGHASQASVDDATFNIYWQDISNALVGLGGARYGAIVNDLKNDCMDPDTEEHYKELLTQWKKDEDNIKDKLEEIEELLKQLKEEKGNIEDKLGEVKGNIEDKLRDVEGNIKDKLEQVENQVKNLSEKMDNLMEPNKTSQDEEEDSSKDAKGRKPMNSDLAEPFNLTECQKELESFYETMNKIKTIPWDEMSAVHIDEIYTTLSWVIDERKPSRVTEKELGDYTEILHGDEHHPNPNRILVYGLPGIGKTTFSKKTALDWSQKMKEILSKYDLVLRIALRDVCDLHDIRDVLRASKLLAGDSKISIDSLHDYILQNQEKVLLILDGYDEYSCAGKPSPIHEIWKGEQLRNCRVILTTRPGQADEVIGPSQVQFKINGFNSEDQVKTFASKFLKEEKDEDVQEFVQYLKEKDLMGMAEIPLLLAMLCVIWQDKHEGLPKSRADIYTNFIQTLLDHMSEKDADSKQVKNVDDYNEELCKLGKLAFDELLRDSLVIRCSELPDDHFVQKLSEAGLCQILNLSGLNRGKGIYFIHKSIQEFLAAWYLKEELSRKDENTTCLSKVDSFEKTVKMIEVFKFARELSAEAACTIVNFLGMIGEKEGLTEYIFAETPSDKDLSNDQRQFLTLILHTFLHCTAETREDRYTVFLSYVGGVLFIDSDLLHSVANEHLLKSAKTPDFIFFSSPKHSEQGYRDLITVLEDVNAVVVSCSGEMKAADLLKKHPFRPVNEFFLKKEEQMNLYIGRIDVGYMAADTVTVPIEMLKELISPPGDQSNEQDNRTVLCLTENIDMTSGSTRHCLSWLSDIDIDDIERQEMETLIEVLPFVTSPRSIYIAGKSGEFTQDAQLVETLVSRINFTNRLVILGLHDINLTAKSAQVIARSLTQAPNLRQLALPFNPLGEGVSDLTRHLSCVPHLEKLYLYEVKMTKKQVKDLSAAVRQSNISYFMSSYHDRKGNQKPEHEWRTEKYWKRRPLY